MLIDVRGFIESEKTYWQELEHILDRIEIQSDRTMDLAELRRFHYLYERASSDLAKISTFAAEKEIRRYLESLVARAYGEIHEARQKPHRLAPLKWFFKTFPQTFRKYSGAFVLSCVLMLAGSGFGAVAIAFDREAKGILMPFSHLQGDPSERVRMEEENKIDRLEGQKASFSSFLMTHNTKVSILLLAMGMTFGVGVVILLFYNGAILGSVCMDYILAGETKFLAGWLLPHGAIEIPAILIAGQAGFLLAKTLIGSSDRSSLRARFRQISSDLSTLAGGFACLLIWAGIVEAFLSQYHEPVIPYAGKIAFGSLELLLLILFLTRSGQTAESPVLTNVSKH
jgi:uncharacterized membrane protein SpoIIM required for sporulation